jgi:hypothetical protein
MNPEQIEQNAKDLARVVIMSFKDEDRVSGWLKNNKTYVDTSDRVVDKAIIIIRKTLQDEEFSLSAYKEKHS